MLIKTFFALLLVSMTSAFGDIGKIPFETAKGKETNLEAYAGKVVLIVNVASRCGFTGQYEGLQKLYEKKKDAGLVVLGFPCNDFGGQEPGTITEIQDFCKTRFKVSFPLMEKVHVKGEETHPLFKKLVGKEGPFPSGIKWNFTKILIGKDGKPVEIYASSVKPSDSELVAAIDEALGK